jgi:hypothetical protein
MVGVKETIFSVLKVPRQCSLVLLAVLKLVFRVPLYTAANALPERERESWGEGCSEMHYNGRGQGNNIFGFEGS